MTKISIIVPVYNAEKYIERCIKSLINQTLKEIEILLIDDGSQDKSAKICDEYAKKDNRIKVIHKLNEGAGISRNKGLKIATGQYIGFIDSDDYIDKSMYEELYKKAIAENVQACFCGSNKVRSGEIIKSGEIEDIILDKEMILKESIPYICSGGEGQKIKGAVSVWRGIYELSFIKKNDITFENERKFLSEDTLFNLMFFSKATKIAFINKHLHYQCIVEESLSRGEMTFSLEAIHNFYNYIFDFIKANKDINQEKCLAILRKRCLEEYRAKIAKEIKKERNRKKIKLSLRELCRDNNLREIIYHKDSIKSILKLKDKVFILLVKYKQYILLKLVFQTSKIIK